MSRKKKKGGGGGITRVATMNFDYKGDCDHWCTCYFGKYECDFNVTELCEKSTSPWSGRIFWHQRFVGVPQYRIQNSWLTALLCITLQLFAIAFIALDSLRCHVVASTNRLIAKATSLRTRGAAQDESAWWVDLWRSVVTLVSESFH